MTSGTDLGEAQLSWVTAYFKQSYFKRKYFFFLPLMFAWHLNEEKFPFEKLIWISKVLVHLPSSEDDWICVTVFCVQLFLPLVCWIQEFRPHWKTLPESLCASALPFPRHSLWLLLDIFLLVESWYFVLFQTGGLHNDEISSGIHLITSRELTSRS